MLASGEAVEGVRRLLVWTRVLDQLAEDAEKVKGSTLHQSELLDAHYERWIKLTHDQLTESRKALLKLAVKMGRVEADGLGGIQAEFFQRGYAHRLQLRADWFQSACKRATAYIMRKPLSG